MALISALLPSIVRSADPLDLAEIVAEPDRVTFNVPEATCKRVVMSPPASSTSAILIPAIEVAVSSTTVAVAGTVFTGASLTALIVILNESTSSSAPPEPLLPWSLVVTVKVSASAPVTSVLPV